MNPPDNQDRTVSLPLVALSTVVAGPSFTSGVPCLIPGLKGARKVQVGHNSLSPNHAPRNMHRGVALATDRCCVVPEERKGVSERCKGQNHLPSLGT